MLASCVRIAIVVV